MCLTKYKKKKKNNRRSTVLQMSLIYFDNTVYFQYLQIKLKKRKLHKTLRRKHGEKNKKVY